MGGAVYTAHGVIAVCWAFTSIDIILVLLRLWVRRYRLREWLAVSDYFILLGLACLIAAASVCTWLMTPRFDSAPGEDGVYNYIIALALKEPKLAVTFFKLIWVAIFLYYAGIYATKAALLAFYFSLIPRFSRPLRILLYVCTVFTFLTFVANVTYNIVGCLPVSSNWSLSPSKFCSVVVTLPGLVTSTVTNVSSDLLLMSIPLLLLRTLQLPRRHLFAFFFVILVGSLSIISAIVRFSQLWISSNGLEFASVSINAFVMWSMLDLATALAAACLPAFRVFLRTEKSKGYQYSGGSSIVPKKQVHVDSVLGIPLVETDSETRRDGWERGWEGGVA